MVKYLLILLLLPVFALASYSPSANIFDSSGLTLSSTSGALNSYLTNTSVAVTGNLGRTWTLASGTDLVTAVQSGTWNFNLPTGASTAANQATAIASLSSIDSKLTSPISVLGPLTDAQLRATAVPISASALPLPSGAATSANQATAQASLTSIDSKLTSPLAVTGPLTDTQLRATPVPISGSITATNSANGATGSAVPSQATQVAGSDGTNLQALKVSSAGVVSVDGSAVTQPVSVAGSVAVTGPLTDTQLRATAVPVSNASLPLPANAAIESGGHLASIDTKLTAPLSVTGPLTDTQLRATAVPVSNASLPLPAGASTSALQTSGNASLTSIDSKLTSPLSVTGTVAVSALPATPAGTNTIGSVKLTDGTNTAVVGAAGNLLVSGASAVGAAPTLNPITVSSVDGAGNKQYFKSVTGTNALVVDGSAVTQPVSAASLPLPSGAATSALQTSGNASLTSIDSKLTSPLTVTGPLTDTQLRATPVPISGTVTTSSASSGVVGSTAPLNATQFGGSDGTNLRAVKVSSTGVVSVDGSATTQPVSAASLPLPTGAATETTLAAINTKTPTLGATTPDLSSPATIPRKLYIPGLTTAASTTYLNVLDAVSSGTLPTDVRDYNTVTVTVLSTATTGSYVFEGAWNSNFTTGGSQTLKAEEITVTSGASLINAAITPTSSTRTFRVNVSDVNYFRMRLSTGYTSGIFVANANLTQQQVTPAQIAVVQATAANLNTTSTVSGSLTTVTTVTGVTTVASVTSSNTAIPGIIADVASAALTTTTTTATLTPTFGSSYQVQIPVTVVSGTTPTLSVQVQESMDTGTNWTTVYTFPTITATGAYVSPIMQLQGNRVRYVQTVTGTTPSFTRAINRLQSSNGSLKIAPSQGIMTDGSASTSATPSTSTQIFAANDSRKYLFIQNLDASNYIYINFTSAAANNTGSIALAPGAGFVMESSYVSTEAVNVLSAAASIKFTAKQQ